MQITHRLTLSPGAAIELINSLNLTGLKQAQAQAQGQHRDRLNRAGGFVSTWVVTFDFVARGVIAAWSRSIWLIEASRLVSTGAHAGAGSCRWVWGEDDLSQRRASRKAR